MGVLQAGREVGAEVAPVAVDAEQALQRSERDRRGLHACETRTFPPAQALPVLRGQAVAALCNGPTEGLTVLGQGDDVGIRRRSVRERGAADAVNVVYHVNRIEQASPALRNVRNHLSADPSARIVAIVAGEERTARAAIRRSAQPGRRIERYGTKSGSAIQRCKPRRRLRR